MLVPIVQIAHFVGLLAGVNNMPSIVVSNGTIGVAFILLVITSGVVPYVLCLCLEGIASSHYID